MQYTYKMFEMQTFIFYNMIYVVSKEIILHKIITKNILQVLL